MAWIVGIDEAGYGPNLGPFIMTAVACKAPRRLGRANLWQVLSTVVRQAAEEDDGRVVVDDSKLFYSPARGLADLERSVWAVLLRAEKGDAAHFQENELRPLFPTLHTFLECVAPDDLTEIRAEPWYHGGSTIPVRVAATDIAPLAARLDEACAAVGIGLRLIRCVVVCAPRFNNVLDGHGSKGAVLAEALRRLLRCCRETIPGADQLQFIVDKHGGRNTYAAQIQHALEDGVVVARREGMNQSVYEVMGLDRKLHLTFQPRADAEHFCVALASMTSKYLRELLMAEFNEFWQKHAPGVKPTAGYPGDAERFYKDIMPAAQRLGISAAALWRRK
jgi:ribonuclease HII